MKRILIFAIIILGITILPKVSNASLLVNPETSGSPSYYITNWTPFCSGSDIIYEYTFRGEYPNETQSGASGSMGNCDALTGGSLALINIPTQGEPYFTGEAGFYWIKFISGISDTYVQFYFDGSEIPIFDQNYHTTQFIYLDPHGDEEVATSTDTDLYASLYLKDEDYVDEGYIKLKYYRLESLNSAIASPDLITAEIIIDDTITSGYNNVSTTTQFLGLGGRYVLTAEYHKPSAWYTGVLDFITLGMYDNTLIVSSSTTFVLGTTTAFEKTQEQWKKDNEEFMASSTASQNVKQYCDLSSSFSLGLCISALFLPTQSDIYLSLQDLKDGIGSRFPLGYLTSFIDIISTSTVGSMTAIDLETPEALGFGKNTLRLDLTHSLDPILTATTGVFSNSSSTGASSTATFFSTTNYYWSIVVYVLTALYVIRRIIGSLIIPDVAHYPAVRIKQNDT